MPRNIPEKPRLEMHRGGAPPGGQIAAIVTAI